MALTSTPYKDFDLKKKSYTSEELLHLPFWKSFYVQFQFRDPVAAVVGAEEVYHYQDRNNLLFGGATNGIGVLTFNQERSPELLKEARSYVKSRSTEASVLVLFIRGHKRGETYTLEAKRMGEVWKTTKISCLRGPINSR